MPQVWVNVPLDQEIESVPSEGYAPIFFPPEGDHAVFFFTDETFLKVYSALRNGAKVTYPDEWQQVVWYFMQNVEFPVSLCDLIADAIIECEQVQDALASVIEGDGVVRDSIVSLVTSDQTINNYITNTVEMLTPEQKTGELIAGSCDYSVVAGKMIALVERLDTNNKDAIENIVIGTNDEAIVSNVIEGIPLFGELPFDDIIEFGVNMVLDFGETYNAASNEERKDQLARDLWCYALEQVDCSVTWEGLNQFFQTRATSGLDGFATALDIVNYVRDGDFDNDELIFNSMFAIQMSLINAGQDFYGINMPKIGAITRDSDPSSAWEDWEDCNPPEDLCEGGEQVDFRLGESSWNIWLSRGLYFSGEGYGLNPAVSGNRVSIWRSMAPEVVRMRFNVSHECSEIRLYIYNGGIDSLIGATTSSVLNGDGTRTYTMSSIGGNAYDYLIDIGGASALDADFRLHWVCWNYDEE